MTGVATGVSCPFVPHWDRQSRINHEGAQIMTIGELKLALVNVPDETELLIWTTDEENSDILVKARIEIHDNANMGEIFSHVEVLVARP